MAIISKNKRNSLRPYRSTQFRYAVTYVVITFIVLLFLNIYCSETSQNLFYQSKKSSMIEKCHIAASEFSELEVLSTSTISAAVSKMSTLRVSRMVVTDPSGIVIFDSASEGNLLGKYAVFPEIVRALDWKNVVSWRYHDGQMRSHAACPLLSGGILAGCVYIMELDNEQGALIKSLQRNILSVTFSLEVAVIFYSLFFSDTFSRRMKRIFSSIRTIREGDYSHKVTMPGGDELTALGAEINGLTERLQLSENQRRQFVSDASHELKTPLASIKLLSDSILQNEMDSDTVKEFVEDIGNEADRLNRMSQKLLTLSKIESQVESSCEIINMKPTIERVTRMLSALARENKITIVQKLHSNCPVLILEDDLYQITFNLVENGIKYNTSGGTLTVTLEREDDTAVMRVADTGVGIPKDSIDQIFERFYRVDKARSRKSGGSGLGLAIVRNMVERNDGTIQVESTLGVGTVFTVTFPLFDTEEVAE